MANTKRYEMFGDSALRFSMNRQEFQDALDLAGAKLRVTDRGFMVDLPTGEAVPVEFPAAAQVTFRLPECLRPAMLLHRLLVVPMAVLDREGIPVQLPEEASSCSRSS
jgi:hypothetical protein